MGKGDKLMKNSKLTKKEKQILIKEFFEFWPLSIVTPALLILIMMGAFLGW
jgi:hypothetical protein